MEESRTSTSASAELFLFIGDSNEVSHEFSHNAAVRAAEFGKLPLPTQTAYARLLDLLLTVESGSPAGSASLVSTRPVRPIARMPEALKVAG